MATERTSLYLRGMPVRVVREAKAAAARRGTTLAAFVSEALDRSLQQNGVDEDGSQDLRDAMRWYEKNRPRLLSRYRGKYVAIVDGTVVDHDRDFEALAGRVFNRLGVRSVFMPHVQESEPVVHLRSPRVVR